VVGIVVHYATSQVKMNIMKFCISLTLAPSRSQYAIFSSRHQPCNATQLGQ
jgi:hypothetical protein